MNNRYHASRAEADTEPGSNNQVLRNFPGIIDPEEVADLELKLLRLIYESVLNENRAIRTLHVSDLKRWHYQWLGSVYGWAGQERSVNLAKGDFHFAAARQIPRLLNDFQQSCLNRFTPTHAMPRNALIEALAITHVELILIHPFREGNGRLSRLLMDVMAVQAGLTPLDYTVWDQNKSSYFNAIQKGMGHDYSAMIQLTTQAVTSSQN